MSKLAKILVTVVVLFLFFLLFSAVVGTRTDSGHNTPGIFGLILFAGVIGAIRAIWKKDSENNNDSDNSTLQK